MSAGGRRVPHPALRMAIANGNARGSTRIMTPIERVLRHAEAHAPGLARQLAFATCAVSAVRPHRGGGSEIMVRLALAPRALGRVLASPETESALEGLVSEALAADGETHVVGVDLACAVTRSAAEHPYRIGADLAARPPPPLSRVEQVREIMAGYFEAQASPPALDVSGFDDEIVIEIETDAMIFSQLEPRLRDAARRVAPKVLLHRRR